MDVLLSYSKNEFLNDQAALENTAATYIQEIVNDFLSLNVGTLGATSLGKLFSMPVEFIFDKITGGELSISSHKVSKAKAMDLLEKPAGYNELLNKIASTLAYLKGKHIPKFNIPITEKNIDQIFTLNENDEVEITEEFLSRWEARYKRYAVSDSAIKMHNLATSIIEKCEELGIQNIIGSNGDSIGTVINTILERDDNKGLKLNIDGLVKYNSI